MRRVCGLPHPLSSIRVGGMRCRCFRRFLASRAVFIPREIFVSSISFYLYVYFRWYFFFTPDNNSYDLRIIFFFFFFSTRFSSLISPSREREKELRNVDLEGQLSRRRRKFFLKLERWGRYGGCCFAKFTTSHRRILCCNWQSVCKIVWSELNWPSAQFCWVKRNERMVGAH